MSEGRSCRDVEKWSDSEYILRAQQREFLALDIDCEGRGVINDTMIFQPSNWKMEFPSVEMERQ